MEGGNGEELAVGCVLSLRTTLGDEIEGQIIAYDRPSNILVIHILLALVNPMSLLFLSDVSLSSILFFDRSATQEGSSKAGPRRNIRLLKANYIQDFTYLRKAGDPIDPNKGFREVDHLQTVTGLVDFTKPCGTLAYPSAKVSFPRDLLESLRLTKEKTGLKKQFSRDPQATAQANTS
ncbi:hypothetical protein BHM03_00051476 [Ensete ventricosum]|nr:hypothetical protein BHM03_00051476 [Ensete ventricosum]